MMLLSNYWTSSPQTESQGKTCFMTEQKNQDIMRRERFLLPRGKYYSEVSLSLLERQNEFSDVFPKNP